MMMTEASFYSGCLYWARFAELCRAKGEAPEAVLAGLVRQEVQRRGTKSGFVTGGPLLLRLRLLVAEALAEARDWVSLQAALRRRGLRLVPADDGLILADHCTATQLCSLSSAGIGHAALTRRFGTGFPGWRPATAARPGFAVQP